jgi:hypothetical protein
MRAGKGTYSAVWEAGEILGYDSRCRDEKKEGRELHFECWLGLVDWRGGFLDLMIEMRVLDW